MVVVVGVVVVVVLEGEQRDGEDGEVREAAHERSGLDGQAVGPQQQAREDVEAEPRRGQTLCGFVPHRVLDLQEEAQRGGSDEDVPRNMIHALEGLARVVGTEWDAQGFHAGGFLSLCTATFYLLVARQDRNGGTARLSKMAVLPEHGWWEDDGRAAG